jgi:hypothetical protein
MVSLNSPTVSSLADVPRWGFGDEGEIVLTKDAHHSFWKPARRTDDDALDRLGALADGEEPLNRDELGSPQVEDQLARAVGEHLRQHFSEFRQRDEVELAEQPETDRSSFSRCRFNPEDVWILWHGHS